MVNSFLVQRRVLSLIGAAALAIGAATVSIAKDFQNEAGTVTGNWDTTVSYGQAWRVQSRDCRLIGTADGGCGRSVNIDDGDLNYDTGLFSRAFKASTELSVNYRSVGAFVRASGLYDQGAEQSATARTPLSSQALHYVGQYTRLLDAFVFSKFKLGSMPAELRVGKQVVSWGESTFIQNGASIINHFDAAALRVPGAELKEGFLPQNMVNFSLQFNDHWSAQAVYLLHWDATIPEPAGSYFSTNDFGTPGGNKVILGFGAFSDKGVDYTALGGSLISDFQAVTRGPDRTPRNNGQGGLAIKYYAPDFNNGTEFGLYMMNYHSRLPVVSGHTGTQAGLGNAWGALIATGGAAQALAAGLPINAAIATAAGLGVQRSASQGGNLTLAQATQYATIGARTALAGGDVATQAGNLATAEYARGATYFEEYPENIRMLALSFNTQIQRGGIALQGEVTYRQNVPLQLDDVELLFAALTPFEGGLATLRGTPLPATCTLATNTLSRCNQLGVFGLNSEVKGWTTKDTWQVQFTATKTFSHVLGAAQAVIVLESAVDYIPGLESKTSGGPNGRGLRYDGPGTSISGNAELAPRQFNEVAPQSRFADATSWGYRLAGRLDYPNLMGPWNVQPRVSWQHDVAGTSPGPGGNFVEGRYGLTLGVGADLRAKWGLDLAYTRFGGAGPYNLINDRDFVAASVKYSF